MPKLFFTFTLLQTRPAHTLSKQCYALLCNNLCQEKTTEWENWQVVKVIKKPLGDSISIVFKNNTIITSKVPTLQCSKHQCSYNSFVRCKNIYCRAYRRFMICKTGDLLHLKPADHRLVPNNGVSSTNKKLRYIIR